MSTYVRANFVYFSSIACFKVEQDGDVIQVYGSETVCSAGEEMGYGRKCTFALSGCCLG